jgi:hypothetical protein
LINFDTLEGHDVFWEGGGPTFVYKDASDLGINVAAAYKLRRMTTCVPLSMEEPYVRTSVDKNGKKTFWYQHLQPVDGSEDYVWSTSGDPFEDNVSGYTVR